VGALDCARATPGVRRQVSVNKIEEMRRADKALDSMIARLMDAVIMQS